MTTTTARLADLARFEAERHPPRIPGRSAAAWCWAALITTASIGAARKAIGDHPDPSVSYAATILLRQLAEQVTAITEEITK